MSFGARASSYAAGGGAWSPLDLPWAHAYWAEGPEFAALGLSDGNNVTAWPDEIGVNNLAAPAGREPSLDIDLIGSQPAVLAASTDRLNGAFSSAITSPYSIVVVQRRTATGGTNACLVDNSSGNATAFYYGGNVLRWECGVTMTPTNPATNTNALLVGYGNGASSAAEVNGTLTSGNAGSNTCNGFTMFGLRSDHSSGYFVGGAAFIGIAPGNIRADGDWATFEAWVTSHYGITIA